MARKQFDPDAKAKGQIRDVFRGFGRATCLTIMAANLPTGSLTEDAAIEAMDNAWEDLADTIIDFALSED